MADHEHVVTDAHDFEIDFPSVIRFGESRHDLGESIESFECSGDVTVVQTAHGLHWFDESGTELAEWSIDALADPDSYNNIVPKSYEVADGKTLLDIQASSRGIHKDTVLLGFDERGNEMWRQQRDRLWGRRSRNGHPEEDFCVGTSVRRDTDVTVKVDIHTGEFVRVVDGPEHEGARFLDT